MKNANAGATPLLFSGQKILCLFIMMAAAMMALVIFANGRAGASETSLPPHEDMKTGERLAMATFAGGCFWCMEYRFEKVPGVLKVFSGYTGGREQTPTYKRVAGGKTGHVEAIRIYYDPTIISYEGLLQVLWRIIDPTDLKGQFVDRGPQYSPAIFYHNARQKNIAMRSRAALRRSRRFRKPVVIPIKKAGVFWLAEDYHQDFYRTQNVKFRNFRYSNPRGAFIKKVWGRDLKLDYSKYRPRQDDLGS
jgi:peptide methionine sulfoxide reductase msrA/msrB